MKEIELRGAISASGADLVALRHANAKLEFDGAIRDEHFDTPGNALRARDELLRVRLRTQHEVTVASLDWKGPKERRGGYKWREEVTTACDPTSTATILKCLGFRIVQRIDRSVSQYQLEGATVRLEHFPRMDDLAEIEGSPESIEAAILTLGWPRSSFVPESISHFVAEYERRTGSTAILARDGPM